MCLKKIIYIVVVSLCIFGCTERTGLTGDATEGVELIPYLKRNGKYVYVEKNTMKIVLPQEYDEACLFNNGLACVKTNNLYGFINKQGKAVIPFQYRIAKDFSDNRAWVVSINDSAGGYRLIDREGHFISGFSYVETSDFKDGLVVVARNGTSDSPNRYGVINVNGKEILPLNYAAITLAEHGLIKVSVAHKCNGSLCFVQKAFNAKTGKELLNVAQKENYLFYNNSKPDLFRISESDSYTIGPFTEDGLAGIYFGINGLYDGMSRLANGFIDTNLRLVVPPVFKPDNEFATALKPIDKTYDDSRLFSCGFAAVRKNNKWGFINKNGRVTIPFLYDDVKSYKEGFAAISVNGKWGFIDQTGREITPLIYDEVKDFSRGIASVKISREHVEEDTTYKRDEWGIVDITGREIIEPAYDFFCFLSEPYAILTKENKKGLARNDGKIIVPPKYDQLSFPQKGYMIFSSENRSGIISMDGEEVMPAGKYTCCYNVYNELFSVGLALCEYKGTDGDSKFTLFDLKARKQLFPFSFNDLRPASAHTFDLWKAWPIIEYNANRVLKPFYVDRSGNIYAENPKRLLHYAF